MKESSSRADYGTYILSPDEEREAILQYQRQSRQTRILQVRAQEMLLASKTAGEFRQRRERDNVKLLQVLKDAWEEEQTKRKAALEADYFNLCKGLGQSHDAAYRVSQNSGALAHRTAKETETNEICAKLRFERALQEEKAWKREVLQEKLLAKERRMVSNEVARIERLRTRNHAHQTRSIARDEEKIIVDEEGPEKYLKIDTDSNVSCNIIHSRLPAALSDYKNTYFHSRFSVLKDRVTRQNVTTGQADKEAEVDAWKAAKAEMKNVEKEKERKAKLGEIWERRKAERGQAATAKLQKIALLEKELAIELEEEKERKCQLQIIEALTKDVHNPEHKCDTWKRLQPTLFPAKKELDGHCEAKTEESGAKIPHAQDAVCMTESMVRPSASMEERGSVPIILQSSFTLIGDEIPVQEFSPKREVEKKSDEAQGELPQFEKTETKAMNTASTKEVCSVEDSKWTCHPSQCKVPALGIEGLPGKKKDEDKDSKGPSGSAKLSWSTPRTQFAAGGTKALKDSRLRSKLSSLPTLGRKRGNKSPQKSEGEKARTVREPQEDAHYVREFKARSKEIEKDQARPSVSNVGEIMNQKSASQAVDYSEESITADAREKSPRKETSSWLSHILEKFPWWKCDTSCKEFSCPSARIKQEKVELVRMSGELADRPYIPETLCKVQTPRKKQNEVSSQETPATRKNVPFRLETLGSLNTLRETDWYCDEQPGLSQARTKVIFTKEELKALKLELYGTLTGETMSSQQKKVILGKGKVKQGQRVELKSQRLNPLPLPSPTRDARWADEEKETSGRPKSPTSRPEDKKPVVRQEKKVFEEDKYSQEDKTVTGSQQHCISAVTSHAIDEPHVLQCRFTNKGERNYERTPTTKDCGTQCIHTEFECMPSHETHPTKSIENGGDNVTTYLSVPTVSLLQDGEDKPAVLRLSDNKVQSTASTFVDHQRSSTQSGPNLEIRKGNVPCELTSAHEVAEELIQAWRAGQIGGDVRATIQRAKQSKTKVSRKRRATTIAEPKVAVSSNCSETTQKLGQLREKMKSSQQNSATKFRKRDLLTPPDDGVTQETRKSISACVKSQDISKSATLKVVQTSPITSNQPKEKCSQVPVKTFSEEATDRRVDDLVSEARSLDFILGSLSAQVRELDERLQHVTACSIGIQDISSSGTPIQYENRKIVSNGRSRAKDILVADRFSPEPATRCIDSLSFTGGNSDKANEPSIVNPGVERVDRAENHILAPPNGPFVSSANGSFSSLQKAEEKCEGSNSQSPQTKLDPPSPPITQAESPSSSMGIYLEDMAELIQEMNGSPACQKMRAQLLQDSFLEGLLRKRETGVLKAEQDSMQPRLSSEKFRSLDTSSSTRSYNDHGEQGGASDVSVEVVAGISSGKVESAIPDSLERSNAEKLGLSVRSAVPGSFLQQPGPAVPGSSAQEPGRISVSSLDLVGTMRLDINEEQLLLSSSIDFSPWKTENLPDFFTSITKAGEGFSYIAPVGRSKNDGSKLEQCYLKETSKYQFRISEFKKKCKAFERKRLGRAKGKYKKIARKPFNPLALPPKRIPSPKSSTRSLQPTPLPGTLESLSKRDMKLTKDSRSKSKLTSRSLPDNFQTTVRAEEVQKWLGRDVMTCLAVAPDDLDGRRRRSVVKYPGTKGSEVLANVGYTLSHQQRKMPPPCVRKTPEVNGRQSLARDSRRKSAIVIRESRMEGLSLNGSKEARKRPSSAGVVSSKG